MELDDWILKKLFGADAGKKLVFFSEPTYRWVKLNKGAMPTVGVIFFNIQTHFETANGDTFRDGKRIFCRNGG